MSVKSYLPTPAGISREAMTVLAGAILAALIVSQMPSVKRWMKDAWA